MKPFNLGLDSELVVSIFDKIIVGMGESDFHHANIDNIIYKKTSFSKKISFDCVYGHVMISSDSGRFTAELKSGTVSEKLKSHDRTKLSCLVSDNHDEFDMSCILELFEKMGQKDPELFRINDVRNNNYYRTAITAWDITFTTYHRDLTNLFVNSIGRNLNFITESEAKLLTDAYGLGNEPLHREHYTQFIISHFEHLFMILKNKDHNIANEFKFNDGDDVATYIESKDSNVSGIVLQSQNNMFLFAKNKKTGVLKIWNTMKIVDVRYCFSSMDIDDDGIFDGAMKMSSMLFNGINEKYEYPCEFENEAYRKLPSTLIENFDSYPSQMIYSSDEGFYPSLIFKVKPAFEDMDCACKVISSAYDIENLL